METDAIVTITEKKDELFLRKKTVPFDFTKHSPKDIQNLVTRMRRMMKAANGIGLSANQIGLTMRVFVAQVPDMNGKQKFYAIFNPTLTKLSSDMETVEEGCLSVPATYGRVTRHAKLLLTGFDRHHRSIKIKAWGLLARVFQHEVDHLDGKLFIDRTKDITRQNSNHVT